MDPIEIVSTRGGFHLHGGPPARANYCIRVTDEEVARLLLKTFRVGRLNGPYRYAGHHPYWVYRVRGDALNDLWDACVFHAPSRWLNQLAAAIEQDEMIKKTMPGRGRGKRDKRRKWRVIPDSLVVRI